VGLTTLPPLFAIYLGNSSFWNPLSLYRPVMEFLCLYFSRKHLLSNEIREYNTKFRGRFRVSLLNEFIDFDNKRIGLIMCLSDE
jgi:hypothetical protein